ncbi:Uncharacterized protein OBRU01_15426, partial [Operophtera brumata]
VAHKPSSDLSETDNSKERLTMHVQGISHWAPANIGPYSQAIKFTPRRQHGAGGRRRAALVRAGAQAPHARHPRRRATGAHPQCRASMYYNEYWLSSRRDGSMVLAGGGASARWLSSTSRASSAPSSHGRISAVSCKLVSVDVPAVVRERGGVSLAPRAGRQHAQRAPRGGAGVRAQEASLQQGAAALRRQVPHILSGVERALGCCDSRSGLRRQHAHRHPSRRDRSTRASPPQRVHLPLHQRTAARGVMSLSHAGCGSRSDVAIARSVLTAVPVLALHNAFTFLSISGLRLEE